MHAGRVRREPVTLGLAVHPTLPPPEIAGRQKVREGHGLGDGHDFPGRVIDELGETHDQSLLGPEIQALGGVAVGDVLEERFRVDRLAALASYDPTPFVLRVPGRRQ